VQYVMGANDARGRCIYGEVAALFQGKDRIAIICQSSASHCLSTHQPLVYKTFNAPLRSTFPQSISLPLPATFKLRAQFFFLRIPPYSAANKTATTA
jgi:hypothetical protein